MSSSRRSIVPGRHSQTKQKRRLKASLLFVLRVLLLACVPPSLLADKPKPAPATYKIGIIPQFDVRQNYDIWNPILKLIEQKTHHKFSLEPAIHFAQHLERLQKREMDFVYTNPFFAMLAIRQLGYVPLVRETSFSLEGIIIAHKDSGIENIDQLQSRSVAYPSKLAFAAYLMPRLQLMERHIAVQEKFVGSHQSVILNVLMHQADAGGVAKSLFDLTEPATRGNLNIIYRTQPVPPHPLLAHSRVPPRVREAVMKAILEIASTSRGKVLLARIPMPNPGVANANEFLAIPATGVSLDDVLADKP